jgi:hypothetical protein
MALENKFSLTVNLKSKRYGGVVPSVTANDNTVFEIKVYDDQAVFPLLETYQYTLVTYKKNKTSVIREGTYDAVTGLIRFVLGSSETTAPGKVEATVQIYDEVNKRVSSAPLSYNVVIDPSAVGGPPEDNTALAFPTLASQLADNTHQNVTTVFNSNGSISETFASGLTKTTTFNSNGTITEVYSAPINKTKTITFNSDGSISEVVI